MKDESPNDILKILFVFVHPYNTNIPVFLSWPSIAFILSSGTCIKCSIYALDLQ